MLEVKIMVNHHWQVSDKEGWSRFLVMLLFLSFSLSFSFYKKILVVVIQVCPLCENSLSQFEGFLNIILGGDDYIHRERRMNKVLCLQS